MARSVARGAWIGAVVGVLVGGVGGRVAMRISTAAGGFSDSSTEETLLWLGVAMCLGMVVGAALGGVHGRWGLPWWAVGLATAMLAFVAIWLEGEGGSLFVVGNAFLNVPLWGAIGFGFGAIWSGWFGRRAAAS